MTETMTATEALAGAVADEQADVEALAALEDAARAGVDVSPAELSEAAGAATLRRLRREKLEAEMAAAEQEAADAERAAALDGLAARAAADRRLDPADLDALEGTALAAVRDYMEALAAAAAGFRAVANEARELGLPIVGKGDDAPDARVAGSVSRVGEDVIFGPVQKVRINGVSYRAPAPGCFEDFVRRIAGLA